MRIDATPYGEPAAPELQLLEKLTAAVRGQLVVAGVDDAEGLMQLTGIPFTEAVGLFTDHVWSWEELSRVLNSLPGLSVRDVSLTLSVTTKDRPG